MAGKVRLSVSSLTRAGLAGQVTYNPVPRDVQFLQLAQLIGTKRCVSFAGMQITVHLWLLLGFWESDPGGCTRKDRWSRT
jgi:hypothetical protein